MPRGAQRVNLKAAFERMEMAASDPPMEWTLDDLRRFLLSRHRRERWLAALSQIRARNLTNFGDVQ